MKTLGFRSSIAFLALSAAASAAGIKAQPGVFDPDGTRARVVDTLRALFGRVWDGSSFAAVIGAGAGITARPGFPQRPDAGARPTVTHAGSEDRG